MTGCQIRRTEYGLYEVRVLRAGKLLRVERGLSFLRAAAVAGGAP